MNLAMCVIELEHRCSPHRAVAHTLGKAITNEQSLMASPRSPKLTIKYEQWG